MTTEFKNLTKRATAAFAALGLGASMTVISLLSPIVSQVHAFPTGGQVQNRSIKMSTSTPGATAQNYLVTFQPASSYTAKGIIVDFCSSSPIIGDSSCVAPTGFDVGGATPTVNMSPTGTGSDIGGAWTAAGLNTIAVSSKRTLKLTNSTGVALTGGTSYTFSLTNVTNPTTLGTFYARIITYTSDTGDIAAYAPGTEGSTDAKDYGGFAMSVASNINITAKVQETLAFCVLKVDLGPTGNQCTAADPVASNPANVPNLTIGHGTPVATIDNSQVDTATAYMQISTNASTGAIVRMHAKNACANAGLSSTGGAACSVSGVDNTVAAALSTTVPNTGAAGLYGLSVLPGYTTTGIAASTGTITPDGNYYNVAHVTEGAVNPDLWFGMDNTATGVTSAYGDTIATTAGAPCNTMNAHLIFGAIAALTTPAGIYTGAESLIATGTF